MSHSEQVGLRVGSLLTGRVITNYCTLIICLIPAKRCPFTLQFSTDNWEYMGTQMQEGKVPNAGFKLTYIQDAIGCNTPTTG